MPKFCFTGFGYLNPVQFRSTALKTVLKIVSSYFPTCKASIRMQRARSCWLSFPPTFWLAQIKKKVVWTQENYLGSRCAACAEVVLLKPHAGCVRSAFVTAENRTGQCLCQTKTGPELCVLPLHDLLPHIGAARGVVLAPLDAGHLVSPGIQGASLLGPPRQLSSVDSRGIPLHFLHSWQTLAAWHDLKRPQICVSDSSMSDPAGAGRWRQGRLSQSH